MSALHAVGIEALLAGSDFDGEVLPDEPMSRHTTYRIGGPARYYVQANSISALASVLRACNRYDVPWVVVGRGSNLLVADEGFPGIVLTLGRDFSSLRFNEDTNTIVAGAGVTLATVVREAFHRSLGGFEFAVDVPGTVGGALRMNAGLRDEWIGERVVSVTVIHPDGQLQKLRAEDLTWDYRCSAFAPDDVIVEAELSGKPSDPFFIRGRMEALHRRRKDHQPLNFPSCGSVFRNPEGALAAKLIEDAGLKGRKVGGAQVSEKHANFIVNAGNATARDVLSLVDLVRAVVRDETGMSLVPEVRYLSSDMCAAGSPSAAMVQLNTVRPSFTGASFRIDPEEIVACANAASAAGKVEGE